MARRLRYPRMCALGCLLTMLCAFGRDACIDAQLHGWAQMLLLCTLLGLGCCFVLMSCRIVVDETGIRVGFLLRSRHAAWDELAALGALCCNSHRMYLYGMYRGNADFVHLLRLAPRCGEWGFVAPLNKKLAEAVKTYCPYPVDLTPIPKTPRPAGLRTLWHQAALYMLIMLPTAAIALITCALMLMQGAHEGASLPLAGGALAMLLAAALLLHRGVDTFLTRPSISEDGAGIGKGVYMPWEEIRFGYVQRMGYMSSLFFLSRPLEDVSRLSAPPVMCLSMPDTTTLLIAYLTYCPHAPKGMEA